MIVIKWSFLLFKQLYFNSAKDLEVFRLWAIGRTQHREQKLQNLKQLECVQRRAVKLWRVWSINSMGSSWGNWDCAVWGRRDTGRPYCSLQLPDGRRWWGGVCLTWCSCWLHYCWYMAGRHWPSWSPGHIAGSCSALSNSLRCVETST